LTNQVHRLKGESEETFAQFMQNYILRQMQILVRNQQQRLVEEIHSILDE
jgi:HPt (histidine-containing phosphotransfer) domain-containing protein